jgi:hypothetical protein
MSVVGALAAALALLTTHVDGGAIQLPPREQARMSAARLVVLPVPGGSYVSDLAEAICPPGPPVANGPSHDGMSLRELRPVDLSGQTTLPLVVGRF